MENITFFAYFIDKSKRLFLMMAIVLSGRFLGQFLLTHYSHYSQHPAVALFILLFKPIGNIHLLWALAIFCVSHIFLIYMSYLGRNITTDDIL